MKFLSKLLLVLLLPVANVSSEELIEFSRGDILRAEELNLNFEILQDQIPTTMPSSGRIGVFDGNDERIGTPLSIETIKTTSEFGDSTGGKITILANNGYIINLNWLGDHTALLLKENSFYASVDCTGEPYFRVNRYNADEMVTPQFLFLTKDRVSSENNADYPFTPNLKDTFFHFTGTIKGYEINSNLQYEYANDTYICNNNSSSYNKYPKFLLLKYEKITSEETGVKYSYPPPITIKEE